MDYIQVLSDMLAIDTTVPPGRNYAKAVNQLEPLFQQANCATQIIPIPPEHAEGRDGRINLLAHRRAPGKPRLIFYGHIDVVPADGWDAFTPKIEDGKIYGRGAADMKGGIAGILGALDKVKDVPLKYDISVIITTDEELSQASQLRYIQPFIQPTQGAYFFSLDASAGFVGVTGLGLLQLIIKVHGNSVHSGLAHLGENAIEKAIPLMNALLELKKTITQRRSKVQTHPNSGLKVMEPRLNINVIHGGLKVNIIPDECVISVDRRLIPEENLADAEKELMACLRAVPDVTWEVEKVFSIPTVPAVHAPIVDELARILKDVTGAGGQYGEMGSGDLSAIVNYEWGAMDFNLGVIRPICNIHGKNEFAYIKDVDDLVEIISRFVRAG